LPDNVIIHYGPGGVIRAVIAAPNQAHVPAPDERRLIMPRDMYDRIGEDNLAAVMAAIVLEIARRA
jgi:hypothetical protein